jgi:hypothetical protein
VWPEQRLDNELARRKALRYQRHRDRWFDAGAPAAQDLRVR